MSTPFSRTMRSLDADGFHIPLLRLLLSAAWLSSWVAWFFLAQVTLYVVSETARLVEENRVVADFPPAILGRIQPGQPAQLRLDGFPRTLYGTVSATVTTIARESHDGRVRVSLITHQDPTSSIPLQRGLTGVVEIEIDRVSPATFVLRAAGQ